MNLPIRRRVVALGALTLLGGLAVPHQAQAVEAPEACFWTLGDYGCTIQRDSTGSLVVYTWVGAEPTVSGIYPPTCLGLSPNGGQICTSTSNSTTVTVYASFESAGTLTVGL